jgi:small-conductance mechanosensitive channel
MPDLDSETMHMLPQWTLQALALATLVLLAATLVHVALQRAGRRLAVVLARRSQGTERAVESAARWRARMERVLLLPELGLWAGAAYYVSERFPLLRQWRELGVCLIEDGFTAPLVKTAEMSYSALDLLLLPVLIVTLWIATGLATRLARTLFFRSSAMQSGAQDTVSVLTRCGLTFIGAVMIFQYWGIDLSSLAVLGGALGVGIGFGLQTIANNFVSGVVIGLERPIKADDYVQVGDLVGTVVRIGARSTEIRTADRVSILVPNSHLIEHQVVNWSHEDPTSRVHLPIDVASDSNLRQVRAALLEAARGHPEVLADPRPEVQFHGFGENGISLELLIWTRDPRQQVRLRSDLYYRIEPLLRRYGIRVPSPQREVHLRAPKIERAVDTWRLQMFPDVESGLDADTTPGDSVADVPEDAEVDPPVWNDGGLAALVDRMRGLGGVTILDRRHFLRVYPRCFIGREAIDWLTRHERLTRDEAVALGRLLVERGLVRHVLDEHDFKNTELFYRFAADEMPASLRAAVGI